MLSSAATTSSACRTSTPVDSDGQLRILCAEDDAGMGWLVRRYLEGVGHAVHLVTDGQQAVEEIQRAPYDVVMLDLLMPHMDGIEAARRIRADAESSGQRFALLAATSHRVEKLDARWDESLFDAVLLKPVAAPELARVLNEIRKPG